MEPANNVVNIDLTVTISVILALCAIVSPILTSIINNHHNMKLKQMELNQAHLDKTTYYIRSIFENYLRYAGRCIYFSDCDAQKDYGEYYFLALVYAPKDIAESMIAINSAFEHNDYEKATSLLENLKPDINRLLKNL